MPATRAKQDATRRRALPRNSPPARLAASSASDAIADRADVPAFPRPRVRATGRRGTDPRPRFDSARGVSAANTRALFVARSAARRDVGPLVVVADDAEDLQVRESRAASASDRPRCAPCFASSAGKRATRPPSRGKQALSGRCAPYLRCAQARGGLGFAICSIDEAQQALVVRAEAWLPISHRAGPTRWLRPATPASADRSTRPARRAPPAGHHAREPGIPPAPRRADTTVAADETATPPARAPDRGGDRRTPASWSRPRR